MVLGQAPDEMGDLVLPSAAADDDHCVYVDPATGQVIIYPGQCPPNP